VAWPGACLSFSMNAEASAQVDLGTATSLMAEAFATWETAPCDDAGGHPSIKVSDAFGPAECGSVEYNARGGNSNLIVFRDDNWPYAGAGRALAVTSVTSNNQGVIYDADMEINATEPLSIADRASAELGVIIGQQDLLSIMTHEAGHFLGLDHSRDPESIMQVSLSAGEVKIDLGEDDIAGICALYPPERSDVACDPTPNGGFDPACGDDTMRGGCSLQRQPRGGSTGAKLTPWLFGLCAGWLCRRKRPAAVGGRLTGGP
ncbi:MAG: matrixin family metalloprotease, partial [Polyangiales bacterium]